MKERRVGVRQDLFSEDERREAERARRLRWTEEPSVSSETLEPAARARLVRLLEGSLDESTLAKLRSPAPFRLTRFELEQALAERQPAMSPEVALTYARWLQGEERGWHRQPSVAPATAFDFLDEEGALDQPRAPTPDLPRAQPAPAVRIAAPAVRIAARLRPGAGAFADGAKDAPRGESIGAPTGDPIGDPMSEVMALVKT